MMVDVKRPDIVDCVFDSDDPEAGPRLAFWASEASTRENDVEILPRP